MKTRARLPALLLMATAAVAQEREPVEQQLVRLMADLRIETRAKGAVDALVALGSAAVPSLAAALEVLPGETLDNQGWKAGVLTALERLGPLAREAGPEVLVAAFTLPVQLSEQAFTTLGAVGPAAHVRCALTSSGIRSNGIHLNGIAIPGTAEGATTTAVLQGATLAFVSLRTAARELDEVRSFLAQSSSTEAKPTPDQVTLWTPLLRDMSRQALVVCVLLPGLKLESDVLPAGRALVRFHGDRPLADGAQALLLMKGRPEEQVAAVTALGHRQTHSRHVVRVLRTALYHSDARVVREAITALGLAGKLAAPAVADLKGLSTNADPQIALRATAALRAIER